MLRRGADILDIYDVLSLVFIKVEFTVYCTFVEYPTGPRLECTVLKEAMLCLCLLFSTWSSHGLLSSLRISFIALRVDYLGIIFHFCNSHFLFWVTSEAVV